ncbi:MULTISPECIES: hemolysin family protein [Paenibacillus]|uniref:hemolysin family protein n=1 Tax=Paenibacillus TaxID=44249 RepID=UPI0007BF30F3|nr:MULTISPECIES: hemolysin family protein [Paenibacillus]OAX50527.1 Magnesium and cobalt efflux protein CorC [Paenibacillus sp. AD87]WDQ34856.1 hemolysin family protein [Paenibacillus marchantiae]SDL25841.1 Hemolysin, contains CBS domains [Paenibacillus sp. OK060]SEB07298.1 Hemolysin, contains CBS domains [Paenibacillus sp. 276b]SHN74323.1 Hemolysin, contains CBS domains [Paenibacillus sp. ov031]
MESERYALNLVLVAFLIGLSAFFVAVEFALVRIRPSRIDQMIAEGNKRALAVKQAVANLDGYLSACQLGITITSLGLGWLGEPTVEKILHPVFESMNMPEAVSSFLSFVIAFVAITYLHVVVGELAPKTIAIRKAEAVALLTSTPIIWFNRIMYPFIWLLNSSANQLVKLFGIKPASEHEDAHSEEELQFIINESFESGKINQAEFGYVSRIFAFDEMLAKEIMVPRTDMVCLYVNRSNEENLDIIRQEQYTRFPVVNESKDDIIGIINTKQFFLELYGNEEPVDLSSLIQPVSAVHETTPVKDLLKKMQKDGVHIAVLVDEYGGTSGIVTIEDVLEQIVGEIRDEFDADEVEDIQVINENYVIMDGKVSLSKVNDMFTSNLDADEWDTIGGWLYSHRPEMNEQEEYEFENLTFVLLEKDKNRFYKVAVVPKEPLTMSDYTDEDETN